MNYFLEIDVPVPMRDGTVLVANIWRPTSGGPVPALLLRSRHSRPRCAAPRATKRSGTGYRTLRPSEPATTRIAHTITLHLFPEEGRPSFEPTADIVTLTRTDHPSAQQRHLTRAAQRSDVASAQVGCERFAALIEAFRRNGHSSGARAWHTWMHRRTVRA